MVDNLYGALVGLSFEWRSVNTTVTTPTHTRAGRSRPRCSPSPRMDSPPPGRPALDSELPGVPVLSPLLLAGPSLNVSSGSGGAAAREVKAVRQEGTPLATYVFGYLALSFWGSLTVAGNHVHSGMPWFVGHRPAAHSHPSARVCRRPPARNWTTSASRCSPPHVHRSQLTDIALGGLSYQIEHPPPSEHAPRTCITPNPWYGILHSPRPHLRRNQRDRFLRRGASCTCMRSERDFAPPSTPPAIP